MSLPVIGTMSYNGVSFGVFSNSKLSMRNVYDDANRTVKFVKWTLFVDGFITTAMYAAGTNTDTDIDSIKAALMRPGGALALTQKGLGAISVNSSTVKDVLWGPRPELLELQTAGSDQATLFKWTCEWHTPLCTGATSYQNQLASYNFAVDFTINRGLTTRTITGSYEIPQTRQSVGSRVVQDTADEPRYRDLVAKSFPPIPGFMRESQSFSISANKNRCDLVIVDVEIGSQNPLPDGTTGMDVEHSLHSTGRGILAEWVWRLSGTVTMGPTLPTSLAWSKFLIVLKERLAYTMERLMPNGPKSNCTMLPIELEFREAVFGLTSSFAAAYVIIVPPGRGALVPQNILTATGLWRRINDTNWLSWSGSLRNDVNHPRGAAGLGLQPSDDVIVDLCVGDSKPVAQNLTYKQPQMNLPKTPLGSPSAAGLWLYYTNSVRVILHSGNSFHRPLSPNQTAIKHEVRAGDICELVMEGWALRLSWPTPVPSLVSVNGQVPERVGEAEVVHRMARVWAGVPVIFSAWRVRYILPREVKKTSTGKPFAPETELVPANPRLGTPAGGMKERQLFPTDSPGYQVNPAAFPPLDA